MLLFEFEAALFELNVNAPLCAPLFQLPPNKNAALNLLLTVNLFQPTDYSACLV